jgi:hypothetical protein
MMPLSTAETSESPRNAFTAQRARGGPPYLRSKKLIELIEVNRRHFGAIVSKLEMRLDRCTILLKIGSMFLN